MPAPCPGRARATPGGSCCTRSMSAGALGLADAIEVALRALAVEARPELPPPVPRSEPPPEEPPPDRRRSRRSNRRRRAAARRSAAGEPPPPPRAPRTPSWLCSSLQRARVLGRADLLVLVQIRDLERELHLAALDSLGLLPELVRQVERRTRPRSGAGSCRPCRCTGRTSRPGSRPRAAAFAASVSLVGTCWLLTPRSAGPPQQIVEVVHERAPRSTSADTWIVSAPPTSSVPSFVGFSIQSPRVDPQLLRGRSCCRCRCCAAHRARPGACNARTGGRARGIRCPGS